MPDLPTGELENAPLEEFIDPQSGIANILNQMTATAQRSRPIETVQEANRPMPSNGMTPEQLIQTLLAQQR